MDEYPELRIVPDPVHHSRLLGCWIRVLIFGIGFWTTIVVFLTWAMRR